MKRLRKIHCQDGFSMLEVMVGLIIFSLGLLLLMSMLVVSINGNSWSQQTTQSAQLIREKVEQLKNTAAGGLASGSDAVSGFNRSWNVVGLTPNLYEVTVAVRWTDVESRQFACSTITYIYP